PGRTAGRRGDDLRVPRPRTGRGRDPDAGAAGVHRLGRDAVRAVRGPHGRHLPTGPCGECRAVERGDRVRTGASPPGADLEGGRRVERGDLGGAGIGGRTAGPRAVVRLAVGSVAGAGGRTSGVGRRARDVLGDPVRPAGDGRGGAGNKFSGGGRR